MISFKNVQLLRNEFKIKKPISSFKYGKDVYHLQENTSKIVTYFNKKKTIKIEFAKKKILGFTLSSFDLKVSSF